MLSILGPNSTLKLAKSVSEYEDVSVRADGRTVIEELNRIFLFLVVSDKDDDDNLERPASVQELQNFMAESEGTQDSPEPMTNGLSGETFFFGFLWCLFGLTASQASGKCS